MSNETIPIKFIEDHIFLIRGKKVMFDSHLAELYGVATKRLNEQIKRNMPRFPDDFMFQLTENEHLNLRSQFATSRGYGGRRYLPYVFTEQGVAMLSSVINSEQAIQVNIAIMRVFVRLREILSANKELAQRLDQLEGRMGEKDKEIKVIFEAIRRLMSQPDESKRKIGFHAD